MICYEVRKRHYTFCTFYDVCPLIDGSYGCIPYLRDKISTQSSMLTMKKTRADWLALAPTVLAIQCQL